MSLLIPLGLLGLIGILVLIIIYIIKPNYQNKFISSTFIWKLSLKYKKKRIPLSKLRNIILFICQVLILAAAAFILAKPILDDGLAEQSGEVVMIIDTSASMQAEVNSQTRLQRATAKALEDARVALEEGKRVSLIIASDEASFLLQQVEPDQADTVYAAFENLNLTLDEVSTYDTPDIKGAIQLAEQITSNNEDVSVTLYTDTAYLNSGAVKIHDVKDPAEWNASILDVRATMVENYYRIEVDVACYGADALVALNCDIYDANNAGKTIEIAKDVYCSGDQVNTLVFAYIPEGMVEAEKELIAEDIAVYSYDRIHVYIDEQDSLKEDNQFYLYGGHKPVLKVQYYSPMPNNYFTTALLVLQDAFKEQWDIEITEVSADPATEGFDVYIFEHSAPATVPSDGVVIYTNTDNIPAAAGVRVSQRVNIQGGEMFLEPGEDHTIMKNLKPENISITQFLMINSHDGYTPLMTLQGYPLLLLKDDIDQKIMVLPFSLHYSNLALTMEFPLLLRNMVNHFFPVMLEDYVYQINDTVTVNARTNLLEVDGPGGTQLEFESFPAQWVVTAPGTYTMTLNAFSGTPVIESVYVQIPASESNINSTEDVLVNPYFFTTDDVEIADLLFYLALALVALLFIEWWLKSREQI